MENSEKPKPYIPVYDREPDPKKFKRAIQITMLFIMAYGGFLIWKNYYKPGAEPPIEKKQLSVPSQMIDSSLLEKPKQ